MHCSFHLTKSDFRAFQKILSRRLTQLSRANTKLFLSNVVVWLPFGFAISGYAALFRKFPTMTYDLTVVALLFSVGVVLLVGGMIFKQHVYQSAMLAPDGWFYGNQTMEFSAEGIVALSLVGESKYPWSSIRHLEEDNANLYLFIDNAQALILPKGALNAPDELMQVKAWLQR